MPPCRSVEFETLGTRRQSDARGGAADTQQALTELLVQARSRNIKCFSNMTSCSVQARTELLVQARLRNIVF